MANISEFRSRLTGGVRSNQFVCRLVFPKALGIDYDVARTAEFLVSGAELPGSTIVQTSMTYMTREIKIPSHRTFANWNVDVINTADFSIRGALESWASLIFKHGDVGGAQKIDDYSVDMEVSQLDRNDVILRTYSLHNCYPVRIGPIKLDFAHHDIEKFDVEFSMDFWTVKDGQYQIN